MTHSPFALRPLGKTDIMVSGLGWGMWRFVGDDVSGAHKLVEAAFEAGINFFDTADIYGFQRPGVGFGDSEALLGKVFEADKTLRGKMVLASKGGITPPMPYNSTTNYLVEACEASLRRLKSDVIDLWQIHRPDLLAHPHEMAAAFDKMKALDALTDGTLDLAIELGASVLAWSPLGGGRIASPGNDARALRVAAELDRVAARDNVSRSSVAYAWIMMHPSTPIPLVGTQNAARILETKKVANVALSRDDWYAILVASRGIPMP
jgi:predicted oxidoreductase